MAQTSWTFCWNSCDISLSCSRPTALWTLDIVNDISFKLFILLASLKIGCSVSSITDVFEKQHFCDMKMCQSEYIWNKIRRSFATIEACSKREKIINQIYIGMMHKTYHTDFKISYLLKKYKWSTEHYIHFIAFKSVSYVCLSLSYILNKQQKLHTKHKPWTSSSRKDSIKLNFNWDKSVTSNDLSPKTWGSIANEIIFR